MTDSITDPLSDPKRPWLRPNLVASWQEIFLVLAVVVGPFAARSAYFSLHGSGAHFLNYFASNRQLISIGAGEGLFLAGLLGILHWRGWTKTDFEIKPGWSNSAWAFLLAPTQMLANSLTVVGLLILVYALQTRYSTFLAFLFANSPHLPHHSIDFSWPVLVLIMLLNAYFEELICLRYAFCQFAAKRGPFFALLLTVLMRMSVHTYQDPIHVIGIGATFFVSGCWYWRTRNLWTIILAHALLDIFSLGLLKTFA